MGLLNLNTEDLYNNYIRVNLTKHIQQTIKALLYMKVSQLMLFGIFLIGISSIEAQEKTSLTLETIHLVGPKAGSANTTLKNCSKNISDLKGCRSVKFWLHQLI
jgi:hypothetical protein